MSMKRVAGNRAPAFGFALAVLLAALLLAAKPAHARTFTVDTTADLSDPNVEDDACLVSIFGGCTLRAAIEQANATDGADTINFDISRSGVQTISPTRALPPVLERATIDGYSQPGASPNSLERGNDAVLLVELDGTNAGDLVTGLEIRASNSVVRGLVINRFSDRGIRIGGDGNRVEGNFIGTDPEGIMDRGNGGDGVVISSGEKDSSKNNTVGGSTPDKRNLISGNHGEGVDLNVGTKVNKVQGNYIGTSRDGTGALGNDDGGVVMVDSSSNQIGGTASGAANTIAFNGGVGVGIADVVLQNVTGNRILSNSIFSNTGLGIDLFGQNDPINGVTENDTRDPDRGPNNLQNSPVLSSATTIGDLVKIEGTLNSTPSARRKKERFTLQFFSSSQADPSGFGEGEIFLGQKSVTTDRKGTRSFSFIFALAQPVAVGDEITATATRNATGDTSEFSNAVSAEPL